MGSPWGIKPRSALEQPIDDAEEAPDSGEGGREVRATTGLMGQGSVLEGDVAARIWATHAPV